MKPARQSGQWTRPAAIDRALDGWMRRRYIPIAVEAVAPLKLLFANSSSSIVLERPLPPPSTVGLPRCSVRRRARSVVRFATPGAIGMNQDF